MYSLFFIQGVFKSHLKKVTLTSNANSHPKSQFDLGPSYIIVLKNAQPPPASPITQGWGWRGANYVLYSLKTLENRRFSNVFTRYRNVNVGVKSVNKTNKFAAVGKHIFNSGNVYSMRKIWF